MVPPGPAATPYGSASVCFPNTCRNAGACASGLDPETRVDATAPGAPATTVPARSAASIPWRARAFGMTRLSRDGNTGANPPVGARCGLFYLATCRIRSAFMEADPGISRSPSLYRKVAEDIKAAIAIGAYPPGTRLPSESELAERYSVSRGTIRQAFAALRADGVIASRRGARRVVVGGPRVQSFGELLSFSRWARAMGEEPGGRVVALRRRPARPAEAERLALAAGAQVYHLTRVRLLSGHPVMIERGTYPDRVGVLVAGMDLATDSITERLEELGERK